LYEVELYASPGTYVVRVDANWFDWATVRGSDLSEPREMEKNGEKGGKRNWRRLFIDQLL